jgi:hypothetical protein
MFLEKLTLFQGDKRKFDSVSGHHYRHKRLQLLVLFSVGHRLDDLVGHLWSWIVPRQREEVLALDAEPASSILGTVHFGSSASIKAN